MLFLLLFVSGFIHAQQKGMIMTICMKRPVDDTLAYLKKFEMNKKLYIDKSFSLLLKDMTQLQPLKAFTTDARTTVFRFSNKNIDSKETSLIIHWKQDMLVNPIQYFEKQNNYEFTVNEKNFYDPKIVEDIMVY